MSLSEKMRELSTTLCLHINNMLFLPNLKYSSSVDIITKIK